MTTVDRILELVKDSGLTAKEFAIGAGIAGGSITDWKTGRSKPSVESLQRIAKYANVQLEWLTGDSEFKTYLDLKRNIIYSAFENSKKDLLNIGIKEEDVNSLLESNLLIAEDRGLDSKTNEIIEKIQNIQDSYSSDTYKEFVNIYTKILHEQKDKFTEQDFNKLEAKYNLLKSAALKVIEILDKYGIDKLHMCPVYGFISAGQPNWAEECLEGYLPVDPRMMNISNPEECFFLRVNGESMNKEIRNGAYALIRKTDVVENGEIAVVLVDKYDATLKKFTQQGDLIILEPMSTDPSFTTQVYGKDTEIKILGKYIGKMEMK